MFKRLLSNSLNMKEKLEETRYLWWPRFFHSIKVDNYAETTHLFDIILYPRCLALWRHRFCELIDILSPLLSSLKLRNPSPVKDFNLLPYNYTQPMPLFFMWGSGLSHNGLLRTRIQAFQVLNSEAWPGIAKILDFLIYDGRMSQLPRHHGGCLLQSHNF